jgi:hypothetical protein
MRWFATVVVCAGMSSTALADTVTQCSVNLQTQNTTLAYNDGGTVGYVNTSVFCSAPSGKTVSYAYTSPAGGTASVTAGDARCSVSPTPPGRGATSDVDGVVDAASKCETPGGGIGKVNVRTKGSIGTVASVAKLDPADQNNTWKWWYTGDEVFVTLFTVNGAGSMYRLYGSTTRTNPGASDGRFATVTAKVLVWTGTDCGAQVGTALTNPSPGIGGTVFPQLVLPQGNYCLVVQGTAGFGALGILPVEYQCDPDCPTASWDLEFR